jgi:hypothetical protein
VTAQRCPLEDQAVSQRKPASWDSPDLEAPRPPRLTLRDLMMGIAVLALVLALAIQSVVIRRRAVELERWGQLLRERERYLQQREDASRRAARTPTGMGTSAGSQSP